jgi:membrane-bound lytic murein transglycosylase B
VSICRKNEPRSLRGSSPDRFVCRRQAGAPFTQGMPNFEVAMREWSHAMVYRRTIVLMAQRLGGG